MKAFNFFVLMIYFLKARGLGSALAIGAGLFQRTVVREMPEEVRRAAAPRPAAATPPTPAPPPAPAETLADVPTVVEAAPLADLDATIVEPAASPWRLRRGDGSGSVALSGETLLGRDKARCQVVVEEGAVSRVHARLTPDPGSGRWRIERLSATGGLWVNDAPVETALLAPGDRIQAGTAVFVMERSG
jgi:pSer/pThr/pTyr-binding forkhead associated (FHA) protein